MSFYSRKTSKKKNGFPETKASGRTSLSEQLNFTIPPYPQHEGEFSVAYAPGLSEDQVDRMLEEIGGKIEYVFAISTVECQNVKEWLLLFCCMDLPVRMKFHALSLDKILQLLMSITALWQLISR